MKMKKTKILACSISILIISGLLLAPSVMASQVDLTPEERIETWLNKNTDLSDPEITIVIDWVIKFIRLCQLLFGQDLGVDIGLFFAYIFVFVPFLIISIPMGLGVLGGIVDIVITEMEFDLDALFEAIGIVGMAVFFLVALPLVLILCVLLYPVGVVAVFIRLYAEMYQILVDEFN